MQKELSHTKKGFSVVEVLLASSIFALLATAFVGSYLYGQESTALGGNLARATFLADEGLEAVRNIRDAGYTNLVAATYGLSTTSNQWNLSGSSDTNGIFTRQITLSAAGTKRFNATSTVTWQQNNQRTGSVSVATQLTKWMATQLTAAENLIISTSGAWVDQNCNGCNGSTSHVVGITVANADTVDSTITSMSVSWSGAPAGQKIQVISINGSSVWTGNSNSGVTLAISPVVLTGGAPATPLTFLEFKKDMSGATITVVFTMSDGSSTTTPAISL